MQPMTRRATVEDAEAVALAHVRGWQVAYKGIVPDEYLDAIDLDARTTQWRQYLAEPMPVDYVVEVNGTVVGFANVGPWREEPDAPNLGELWAMYVHPDHWGTGAGYALMQATMNQFRSAAVETGYLWVLEENVRARTFYERQGWVVDDATKEEDIAGVTIVERRYSIAVT